MPARRSTQAFLQNLFAAQGLHPQRRLGQNFLIELNLHELIVNAANLTSSDLVLEVGSGTGALTELLAEKAGWVLAVEIDRHLTRLTRDTVARFPHVQVLGNDILARKSVINPDVLDRVRIYLADQPQKTFKVVANLPYSIATPLILNLLVDPDLCPSLMVLTIQRELAERMRAKPKTHTYGALSILAQALADIEILRILPPTVFWPQPKVESAIIRITPRLGKRATIADVGWFHGVIRKLFLHRRKNLRQVLSNLTSSHQCKADVETFLQTLGLSGGVRAEDLNVEEHISLAHALKGWLKGSGSAARDESVCCE